jgi:hypothetical protein
MPRLLLALMLLVASGVTAPPAAARPRCAGDRATIVGTPERDRLRGTERRDVIAAGDGADAVDAREGDDIVCGDKGIDRIHGGAGNDRLLGSGGRDTIDGDEGTDAIAGGGGADACFHGSGSGTSRGCVPVIAAAGDIACGPNEPHFNGSRGRSGRCHMRYTSDIMLGHPLAAVLPLGDLQYPDGALSDFMGSYDITWGRLKEITKPVPGNHDYYAYYPSGAGEGYYEYFGALAGDPDRGYYSYDIGTWHLVALNTSDNCNFVGGCGHGSPQQEWLASDLRADRSRCTLAYWHEPLFSLGGGGDQKVRPFWETLFRHDAEVVLNGHDHAYGRFTPRNPNGGRTARGIHQFIVGTGGDSIGVNSDYGVLELALRPGRYDWRFVPEAGASFTDSGSGRCH